MHKRLPRMVCTRLSLLHYSYSNERQVELRRNKLKMYTMRRSPILVSNSRYKYEYIDLVYPFIVVVLENPSSSNPYM